MTVIVRPHQERCREPTTGNSADATKCATVLRLVIAHPQ